MVDDAEPVERYRDVASESSERVYVRVRGRLGGRGPYGHRGECPRRLAVERVFGVRPRADGER